MRTVKSRLPRFTAPALHPHVIAAPVIAQMVEPDKCAAHWLCASAGAGKTQAVRLWVETAGRPYAWIQIDESDNDPFCFLEHLFEAMRPFMDPRAGIPVLCPQGRFSLERQCEFLWDTLIAALQDSCILVLDDAHHIKHSELHPALHHILSNPHPRLHLVVVSRRELPERYSRGLVNQDIRLIEGEAFVWHSSHLSAWLASRWSIKNTSASFVEELLQISQGCAGVLALLDVKALRVQGASIENAAVQLELKGMIERILLRELGPDEREILRWLACVGSFPEAWLSTLDLPGSVIGSVQSWLQEGSMVVRLDRSEQELRFHPLCAELLRKGERIWDPGLAQVCVRMIDACICTGRAMDAMALAKDAKAWDRYWALLQVEGLTWVKQGQMLRLSQAISVIPADIIDRLEGPVVTLFSAASILHQDPEAAYWLGLEAIRRSSEGTLDPSVWAMAIALVASSVVGAGKSLSFFEPIVRELNASIETEWFAALAPAARLNALKGGVIASLSGTELICPAILFEQAHRALNACQDVELKADVLSAMMRVVALHGLSELFEPIALALLELEGLVQTPSAVTALWNAKTSMFLALGQKSACVRSAEATLKGYREDVPSVWKAEVLCIASYSAVSSGELRVARRYCEELEQLASKTPYRSALMHWRTYAGAIAAHDGALTAALDHLVQAVSHADAYGYPLMQIVTRAALIVVLLELQEVELAQAHLDAGDKVLARCNIPYASRIHAGSKAFFSMKVRSLPRAKAELAAVFELMSINESYSLGIDLLPQNRDFYCFALEHDIALDTVVTAIRRAPLYPAKRPHPRWPSLFEVEVLGAFEIRVNGSCSRARFVSSGARFELLTAILWDSNGACIERCAQEIWSHQKDQKRRKRAMNMALKRLRDDLGRHDAILEVDGKLLLNPELWSVDAWDLATTLQGASPKQLVALKTKIARGFVGPTPIPAGMRHRVPQRGARDLGPEPLLAWLLDSKES